MCERPVQDQTPVLRECPCCAGLHHVPQRGKLEAISLPRERRVALDNRHMLQRLCVLPVFILPPPGESAGHHPDFCFKATIGLYHCTILYRPDKGRSLPKGLSKTVLARDLSVLGSNPEPKP